MVRFRSWLLKWGRLGDKKKVKLNNINEKESLKEFK